jgi:hypothetical protein
MVMQIVSPKTVRGLLTDLWAGNLIAMFSHWMFFPFRQGASPLPD